MNDHLNSYLKKRVAAAYVCSFAFDLIFSGDSNESESSNDKILNFCETIVPSMNHKQFKMHFRINSESFEIMLQMLHSVVPKDIKRGRPNIPLEKEVLITVWCLSNLESFRSVATRFGVTKSTCWLALYRTCTMLLKVNESFKIISWPLGQKAVDIINHFETRYGMPGVLGVIDGSHIPIMAPRENHVSYVNRKGFHSVVLQAICECNMLFTDVYCGEVGSLHDYTVFKRSDFYKEKLNDAQTFPVNSHLIGDLAYNLSVNLLVGFKDYGNLSQKQKNYNLVLSKTRAVIENAFGLLKGRFRRLKSLETVRLDLITLLIVSACILHNICIYTKDDLDGLLDINAEACEEINFNPDNVRDLFSENKNNTAITKRNDIVNSLSLIM